MKQKISVSMEKSIVKQVEERVKDTIFRNKSHFIEYAVEKMLNQAQKESQAQKDD